MHVWLLLLGIMSTHASLKVGDNTQQYTVCVCNPVQGLLVWNPFTKAPGGSQLLLEAIVKASQPMDGNSCPVNATNPLQGCEPGFYCPTPAEKLPCPLGDYCPGEPGNLLSLNGYAWYMLLPFTLRVLHGNMTSLHLHAHAPCAP